MSLGFFELEEDAKLELTRIANGGDILKVSDTEGAGNLERGLVKRLCLWNDKPLSDEQIDNLDVGLINEASEILLGDRWELHPLAEENCYQFVCGDRQGETVKLKHRAKGKDQKEARRRGNGKEGSTTFWLIAFLIEIDDTPAQVEKLWELPGWKILRLVELVAPKKDYTFQATSN